MSAPTGRAFCVFLLAGASACGATFGRYPDGPPTRTRSTGRSVAPAQVVLASNGSTTSWAAAWMRPGNAACDWSWLGVVPSAVTAGGRPVSSSGMTGYEVALTYEKRLDLACPDFQAAPALLAPGAAPATGRWVADVRSRTHTLPNEVYERLVCGWTSAAPRPGGDFAGQPLSECRTPEVQALVAQALDELREDAARVGANQVHDVQCYGHSADGRLRFWCEGEAHDVPAASPGPA